MEPASRRNALFFRLCDLKHCAGCSAPIRNANYTGACIGTSRPDKCGRQEVSTTCLLLQSLAFELDLQDFAWQGYQAGLREVGGASQPVHPNVIPCLMIRSAFWSHAFDFQAESALELE